MSSFFKYLRDGSEADLTSDYSGGSATYALLTNTTDSNISIQRMVIYYGDASNWSADEFANTNSALANGLLIHILDDQDVVQQDITDGVPLTTNAQLSALMFDVQQIAFGSGDDHLASHFTFSNAGDPLLIPSGHKFGVRLQDDFSGLTEFYINAQGVGPDGF